MQTPLQKNGLKNVFKKWILGPHYLDNEITILKNYIKNKNDVDAYQLGKDLLQKAPKNEFVSYASAWGALRLGKLNEVPELISTAITTKPDYFKYVSLRGNAYFKLGLYREAHPDFEKMVLLKPDDQLIWKNLLKIRTELKIKLPPPPIYTDIHENLNKAYQAKDWPTFDSFIETMRKIEPLTARYWQLQKNDFLVLVGDPAKEWSLLHDDLRAKDHDLSFNTYFHMVNAIAKTGDLIWLTAELPKFKLLYNKPCPTMIVSAVCAVFLRHKQYEACLSFLRETEEAMPDDHTKLTFWLKSYPYRLICLEATKIQKFPSVPNKITDGLLNEMRKMHDPNSASAKLVQDCIECWKEIRNSSHQLLLDLRYNPEQITTLQSKILEAIKTKIPLSLVRIMDGESYGFIQDSTNENLKKISSIAELAWWGKHLEPNLKKKVVENFYTAIKSADIIGFPGATRLAQLLNVESRTELSLPEMKYQVLFSNIKKLLNENQIAKNICWVDEFCCFALTDEKFISKLIDTASSVVLVTCFEIPNFHIFDNPKVKIVSIPPHSRVSSVSPKNFGEAILPEVTEKISEEIRQHLRPGSLLLVSAGFAGKSFMDVGKKASAVAIDFGAALDDMLGHKTRSSELHAQFSQPKKKQICTYTSAGIERKDMVTNVLIKLEDPRVLPSVKWRSYYAGTRQRFSLATGVKFIRPDTIVCNSLLARKIYMFRFDLEMGTYRVIDSIATTFQGQTTETDLLDIDDNGNIFTSNCGTGSATQYRYENDKLFFVKDLPIFPASFVHGLKFFKPDMIVGSLISASFGAHFLDINTLETRLLVKTDIPAKDVCFLSDHRMVVLTTYGKLTGETDDAYNSEIQLIDFNIESKTYKVISKALFKKSHFDCAFLHNDKLYINEQFSDCIYIVNPANLKKIGEISGYDFPHGIDIKHNMIAITNYGSNSVDIRRFDY